MVKRKSAKKMEAKNKEPAANSKDRQKVQGSTMPLPELLLKILAGVLSVILVIALTLYVLGRMPARGFWTLIIILAIIAFVIIPAMRKRFLGE